MSHFSYHEVAELWEITRDHIVTGSRLNWLTQSVQEPPLRQSLQQFSRQLQQEGHNLLNLIRSGGQGSGQPGGQNQQQMQSLGSFGPSSSQQSQPLSPSAMNQGQPSFSSTSAHNYMTQPVNQSAPVQPLDAIVVMGCLSDCKALAERCIVGATEAGQPARNYLYRLAGEHLQLAELAYQWLHNRGLYAAPTAAPQATQQIVQTLEHISNATEQIARSLQQHQEPQSHFASQPGQSVPQHQGMQSMQQPAHQAPSAFSGQQPGVGPWGSGGQGSPYQNVPMPGHAGAAQPRATDAFNRPGDDDPLRPSR